MRPRNSLNFTLTQNLARPGFLGPGAGIGLIHGDEKCRISGVGPQFVVAHGEREISFRSNERTKKRTRGRAGEPATDSPRAAQSGRQPASDFYLLVHHSALKPFSAAKFARRELCPRAATGSLERAPVLERPVDDLPGVGIAIKKRQQTDRFALLRELAGHLEDDYAAGRMTS